MQISTYTEKKMTLSRTVDIVVADVFLVVGGFFTRKKNSFFCKESSAFFFANMFLLAYEGLK